MAIEISKSINVSFVHIDQPCLTVIDASIFPFFFASFFPHEHNDHKQ